MQSNNQSVHQAPHQKQSNSNICANNPSSREQLVHNGQSNFSLQPFVVNNKSSSQIEQNAPQTETLIESSDSEKENHVKEPK